jgi:hypothetical protein
LISELNAWAGLDKDQLLYFLADNVNDGFNVLTMKVVKALKDLSEEK